MGNHMYKVKELSQKVEIKCGHFAELLEASVGNEGREARHQASCLTQIPTVRSTEIKGYTETHRVKRHVF